MAEKLWQLKQLSTGKPLNEPQLLPTNWGGIFGMEGFKDKLDDLSWLGLEDQGWFIVGDAPEPEPPAPPPEPEPAPPAPPAEPWNPEKYRLELLKESDWSVLPDVPMVAAKREAWIEYRRLLRELPYEENWPNIDIDAWPQSPRTLVF